MLEIKELIWDEWNIAHIAKHGVTPETFEEICYGSHIERKGYRERLFLVGPTKAGRMLSLILEDKWEGKFYPITAFDASKRSIAEYNEEKGGVKA